MYYVNEKACNGWTDLIISEQPLQDAEVVFIGNSFQECEQAIQWELDT